MNAKFKEIASGLNTYRLQQDKLARERVFQIAMGHALACVAPIPVTSMQDNGEAYFLTNIRSTATQIVAAINEIRLVDIDAIITHMRAFWTLRLNAVNPNIYVPSKETGFFVGTTGATFALSPEVLGWLNTPEIAFDVQSVSNFIRLKLLASGEAFGVSTNSVIPLAVSQSIIGV